MIKAKQPSSKARSLCLQQVVVPDYRIKLIELLHGHWGSAFEVYAGDRDFGGSPQSADSAWGLCKRIQNKFIFGGRLLWQSGCIIPLVRADVSILNGNLRIVSNCIVLIIRKALRRPTLLWGHAIGKNELATHVRGQYLRFSDGFIAYTNSQADDLRSRYPWLRVWVAPNACVSKPECFGEAVATHELDSFLYVGRLVEAKKVSLLLAGFIEAKKRGLIPKTVRLVFIGDGEDREALEETILKESISSMVELAGHISDVQKLKMYYRSAICSVSPGYVGLSATQSFSFGVPMLIADAEFHSPEIEACQVGFNTEFFQSNNPSSLAEGLAYMYDRRGVWEGRRNALSLWTAESYSFEAMRKTLIEAVSNVEKKTD
jgi:glycosyltransferase involved in cell wall biosynthesis